MNTIRILVLGTFFSLSIPVTLALQGCGGGGGGSTTATTPTTPTVPPVVTPVPTPTIAEALTELNRLRASAEVNAMVMDAQVTKAAENHANYIVTNKNEFHTEEPQLPGFTGVTVKDRLTAVGYNSYTESEGLPGTTPALSSNNPNPTNDPVRAVQILFSVPYHGMGLLNGHHDFGMAKNGATFVVNVASKTMSDHSFVPAGEVRVWPCNGITNILNKTLTGESPNPLPGRDMATNPIGTPTYVIVRNGNKLVLTSYEIRGPSGAVPIAKVLGQDVADLLGANPDRMAILPNAPLATNTTYTSTVTGTNNGAPFSKVCQFTTGTF